MSFLTACDTMRPMDDKSRIVVLLFASSDFDDETVPTTVQRTLPAPISGARERERMVSRR